MMAYKKVIAAHAKPHNIVSILSAITLLSLTLGAPLSHSHSRWVVPSHTILSGENPEHIAIDLSISNDIFHVDLAMGGKAPATQKNDKPRAQKDKNTSTNPMQAMLNSTRVQLVPPSGAIKTLPLVNLGRKSATSALLEQSGTYRIDVKQAPIDVTVYTHKEGNPGRAFGTIAQTKNRLPAGAHNIHSWTIFNTIQSFVTRNNVTQDVLQTTGNGLEVNFKQHPNELFTGETSQFQLTLNNQPLTPKHLKKMGASHSAIKVTRHNTRYRNARKSLTPTLNTQGVFTVQWPAPGLYLIEAEVMLPAKKGSENTLVYALYLTLDVYPE